MLCSKCKKRPAVVFVSNTADSSNTTAYCLVCAREMGIKPVTDIMEKMGISEDDLANIQEQMDDLVNSGLMPDADSFADIIGDNDDIEEDDDDFSRGGAPTFPPFFKNLFNSKDPSEKLSDKDKKKEDKKSKNETPKRRKNRKHIDAYCTDLTQRARDGKLDRIIGRENEIGRVIQILSRRTKNNPCLIGEPGVGKTAIAEGLHSALPPAMFRTVLKIRKFSFLTLLHLLPVLSSADSLKAESKVLSTK